MRETRLKPPTLARIVCPRDRFPEADSKRHEWSLGRFSTPFPSSQDVGVMSAYNGIRQKGKSRWQVYRSLPAVSARTPACVCTA